MYRTLHITFAGPVTTMVPQITITKNQPIEALQVPQDNFWACMWQTCWMFLDL